MYDRKVMWFTKRIEWKGNPPIMQEETKQETIKEPALQKDTVAMNESLNYSDYKSRSNLVEKLYV